DSNLIMQKALSLYIDSQLFEKNRLARLSNQENYQKQIKEKIAKYPCPLPHFPLHDGLLLDLRQYPKITRIKHSQLGLNFFEEAYLDACPYQFAKISLENLENVLNYLKAELE
ncbi:MAG: PLP-dependent aminotransferase family protein, partial [Streptococcus mitis]|nr:PLP-dependent aminotransferase family protein [Streptococcus mitis]